MVSLCEGLRYDALPQVTAEFYVEEIQMTDYMSLVLYFFRNTSD